MREHERSMLLNPIANFFSKMEYPATHNNMAERDNPAAIQPDIEEPPNPAALQPDIAEPDNLDFSEFRENKKYARIFQPTWLHQFPWIELSMDKTKAFCNLCKWAFQNKRLGPGVRVEVTWTTKGYSNYRKALGKNGGFKTHEKSECHRRSALLYNRDNLNSLTRYLDNYIFNIG